MHLVPKKHVFLLNVFWVLVVVNASWVKSCMQRNKQRIHKKVVKSFISSTVYKRFNKFSKEIFKYSRLIFILHSFSWKSVLFTLWNDASSTDRVNNLHVVFTLVWIYLIQIFEWSMVCFAWFHESYINISQETYITFDYLNL